MREDLKAEEINKVFSFAMLKAFIASSITHYLLWFRIGSYMKGKKQCYSIRLFICSTDICNTKLVFR